MKPTYCFCSTQRTGSTLLAHLLKSSGHCDFMLEYFTEKDHFFERMESFKGVWGVNLVYQGLRDFLDVVGDFSGIKFIFLRRENVIKQSISFAIAHRTNNWYLNAEDPKENKYVYLSPKTINRYLSDISAQNSLWSEFFLEQNIQPLKLYYEDFQDEDNFLPIVNKVLDFIGIDEKADSVSAPIQKQYNSNSEKLYNAYLKGFKYLNRVI